MGLIESTIYVLSIDHLINSIRFFKKSNPWNYYIKQIKYTDIKKKERIESSKNLSRKNKIIFDCYWRQFYFTWFLFFMNTSKNQVYYYFLKRKYTKLNGEIRF